MKKTPLESLFDDPEGFQAEYLTVAEPAKKRTNRPKSRIHKVVTHAEAIAYGGWQYEKTTDDELSQIRSEARELALSDAELYRIAGDVSNRKVTDLGADLTRGQACSLISILKQRRRFQKQLRGHSTGTDRALGGAVRVVFEHGEPGPDFDNDRDCIPQNRPSPRGEAVTSPRPTTPWKPPTQKSPTARGEAVTEPIEPIRNAHSDPAIRSLWDQRHAFKETLSASGLEYLDKSPKGGCLWVIGGPELKQVMDDLRRQGMDFAFKPCPRATRRRPAWWTRNCPSNP
jgi:hypothetical protein